MAVVVAGSIDGLIRAPRSPQLFDSRNDSAPHRGTGDIACFQELICTPSGIEASPVPVPVNYQLGRPIDVAVGGHAAMRTSSGFQTLSIRPGPWLMGLLTFG